MGGRGTITLSGSRTEKTEETRARSSPRVAAGAEGGGTVVRTPISSTRQAPTTTTTTTTKATKAR